jgi:chorismate dehydratase
VDEFKGKLGNYKIIKTEDLSETVWSEYFNEACHNISGATEETIHNYINGCNLIELFQENNSIHILDVGFGIGLGLTCLINFINNHNFFHHKVQYTSIELDDILAIWALEKFHPNIKIVKNSIGELHYLTGKFNNISIQIFIGDGRITLPQAFENKILPQFQAIFQDPFSPKKNTALWTVEWFSFLKNNSVSFVRMATYSSGIRIRKSMQVAGWIISNHPGFGNKKNMTKANLNGQISNDLLDQLARSPAREIHDIELHEI